MLSMLPTQHYEEEIRRLESLTRQRSRFYREQWQRTRAAERASRRSSLAEWAGDRLVTLGESLRAWSAHRQHLA